MGESGHRPGEINTVRRLEGTINAYKLFPAIILRMNGYVPQRLMVTPGSTRYLLQFLCSLFGWVSDGIWGPRSGNMKANVLSILFVF